MARKSSTMELSGTSSVGVISLAGGLGELHRRESELYQSPRARTGSPGSGLASLCFALHQIAGQISQRIGARAERIQFREGAAYERVRPRQGFVDSEQSRIGRFFRRGILAR